jgi:hypothetical protein
MTTETKFRAGLTLTLIALIFVTFEFFEKDREYNEMKDSLSHSINKHSYDSLLIENKNLSDFNDSVRTELFIERNTVGRYDMALDSLKTANPKAEKQFQDILNSGKYE